MRGAATHLAVPACALVLILRRAGARRGARRALAARAALAGGLTSGATGLLVWGEAQTTLRGQAFRVGIAHFWLGIALAVVVCGCAAWRLVQRRSPRAAHGYPLPAGSLLALGLVAAQGYRGGRMTYEHGVGVFRGGRMAQSAAGAKRLEVALAGGQSEAVAGRAAFAASGLGCARCHGARAEGRRAPRLAGGEELPRFRRKHGDGLFPRTVVTNDDFRAIDAWLRTLPRTS